jgi:glycosyltransferase involved in cell wall biosynthesis
LVSNSKVGGIEFKEIGFPESKIFYIPNGVEIPKEKKIFFAEVKLVMTVARLSSEKGIDVLLKAWAEVAALHPALRLVIAGQGPLEPSLKKLCKDLRLADSVEFLGSVPNLNEQWSNADLFVLPSRTEGLSNALLEAMSYGIPCIATRVGGNGEILGGEGNEIPFGGYIVADNGLLVNPDDPKGLSEAVLYLIRHPEARELFGKRSRRFVEENYSIDLIAERYISLYKTMLSK